MARADSTIRVNIIGDAKDLQKAAGKAEGAIGGMNKKLLLAGGAIAGVFAADQLVDFGQTALKEADRVGDAAGRLEAQLGNLAPPIRDAADEMAKLGLSEGDVLDLVTRFNDLATAAGLSKENLAKFGPEAAEAAGALALITDTDADTWLDLLGKAAGGAEKPLKELGVRLTDADVEARALADSGKDSADALTDNELAAARLELILEQLNPRITDTITGTGDLEQKQSELQARFETLTGKIGEALEGPLTDFLGWLLTTAEWLDKTGLNADDLAEDIQEITDAVKALLSPLARAIDLLAAFNDLAGQVGDFASNPGGSTGGQRPPSRNRGAPGGAGTTTINVQGGSPEAIEQAVRRALNTTARRG